MEFTLPQNLSPLAGEVVKTTQKRFRDEFLGTALDPNKMRLVGQGAGMGVTVGGGNLTITTGVTPNSTTIIETVDTFTIPFKIIWGMSISQKIANQEVAVELVRVDPATGLNDETQGGGMRFNHADSSTNTTARGYAWTAVGDSADTGNISSLPAQNTLSLYELEMFEDELWVHGRVMNSSAARLSSGVIHGKLPDMEGIFRVRIVVKNLGTAPASTTTIVLPFLAIYDHTEICAEITSGRGASSAGQALPVTVLGTPNVNATQVPQSSTSGLLSNEFKVAAASTNSTSLKASAGRVFRIIASNTTATNKYLKFYNKATAPTVGTDTPMLTVLVPPNNTIEINGTFPIYFATGIGYAITGGAASADTTAVAAGDVIVHIGYN